jgi:hypothetical protein
MISHGKSTDTQQPGILVLIFFRGKRKYRDHIFLSFLFRTNFGDKATTAIIKDRGDIFSMKHYK